MSIQLKDYIKVFPDAIDHKFCSDLIKNKKYKYEHTVILDAFLTRKKDTTIRNCLSTPLLKEDDDSSVMSKLDKRLLIAEKLNNSLFV